MKLFKRLRCLFGHHEAWKEPDIPPPPPAPGAGTILGTPGTMGTISIAPSSVFHINLRPFNTQYRICRHCHRIFWETKVDQEEFLSAHTLPRYDEWLMWYKEKEQEEKDRQANSTLQELWDNYQMARRLYREEPKPPYY